MKEITNSINITEETTKNHKNNNVVKEINQDGCSFCSKGNILIPYRCKCQLNFCKKHRLPENHNCHFDFKEEGRNQIKTNNPLIMPNKLLR